MRAFFRAYVSCHVMCRYLVGAGLVVLRAVVLLLPGCASPVVGVTCSVINTLPVKELGWVGAARLGVCCACGCGPLSTSQRENQDRIKPRIRSVRRDDEHSTAEGLFLLYFCLIKGVERP